MSGYNDFIGDSIVSLFEGGQPLKGEGRPFHPMNNQAIIQVAAIFHPDLVFFLSSQVGLLVHWRE